MKKIIEVPQQVQNDEAGLYFLNFLLFEIEEKEYSHFILDFKRTRWFEANLTSVLGAIIHKSKIHGKSFRIENINTSILNVFKKNGFLEYYNLGKVEDVYQSTIKYKVFNVHDTDAFARYVSNEVIPKIRLTLDKPVEKSFISSLNEIFVNVGLHAKSNEVFTCGQYYHKHKMVAFTIVDLGNTIPHNIKQYNGCNYTSDKELINWSTQYGNTTREDSSVGGLGLDIINSFLEENKGVFQIVSGKGFWQKNSGFLSTSDFNYHFPGTIVNIITKLESTVFNRTEEILF